MAKEINLQIKNLSKIYDKKTVLNNLNFEVYDGEFLSILGPSGCGKTTLLKILIGIEKAIEVATEKYYAEKIVIEAQTYVKKMYENVGFLTNI